MIKHLTQEPAQGPVLYTVTQEPVQGPITVHCSAGIGRTGTILLVLHLLDQLNTSGFLDPHQALVDLRNGRPRLVENSIQYVFGHKLLLEVLSDIKTSFTCSAFLSEVEGLRVPQPPSNTSLIHQQYQKIKSFPKNLKFNFGLNPECAHLNRTRNILPADSRIVYLQNLTGSANGFYINAVRVNALEQTDAYIVADYPPAHTGDV
ncbi:receptor-type tyrosine-protein phosphatase alpha-like [Homarus americanus]|uniref:receptor-type tyrosine-protein phosphatase alpha-like n=1 Tax=Homarus americanus TaxID=6706 RepID=UPI001C4513EC|nr:receptor-type tyrosine-protein phosphatase alpha-like [Homarus americanus]